VDLPWRTKHLLKRWYGAERLGSPLARKTFILPGAPA
jgi:hypothetical protein